MIKDEVTKNQGGTFAARSSPLIMRKNACKKINKMFGLNIDVRFRNETPETPETENKGGDDIE